MALGRTPRELLASVTSADITEAMAWEKLEPFGALHQQWLVGQVCALLANLNLRPKDEGADPWQIKPWHFMPELDRARNGYQPDPADQPVAVADADQQSELLTREIFGAGIPERWVPPGGSLAAFERLQAEQQAQGLPDDDESEIQA